MTLVQDPHAEVLRLLELERELTRRNKLDTYYPDAGPLRRDLYPKHMEFFRAGLDHRERALIAANRIGKSEGVGAYETTLHLTGRYPSFWKGRRFNRPINAWVAGDSAKTVRDICQRILLGPIGEFGTGMIPADCLLRTSAKPGVSDAIEGIYVKHASGGTSELILKSYDQGREAFQGTNRDLIWLDEEMDRDIYVECLLRTMTTNGIIMLTFTPLLGLTDIVRDFLTGEQEAEKGKFCIQADWDDVPHLSAEAKAELLLSIPPYQREARSKGVPQLGSGAIYQIPESDIVVTDFEIPAHYQKVYGYDIGWNKISALLSLVIRLHSATAKRRSTLIPQASASFSKRWAARTFSTLRVPRFATTSESLPIAALVQTRFANTRTQYDPSISSCVFRR